MALPRRHLIRRALAFLGLLVAGAVFAAPEAKPMPMQFRVLALGDPMPLADILYDFDKQPTPLQASDISLSPLLSRKAEDASITLYRAVPAVPPETRPGRLPLSTVKLGSALNLVVLKATGAKVSATAFDDSWTAFPPGTIRVISFSKRKIAAQIEGSRAEVAPNSYHFFNYPDDKSRIRIKIAAEEDGVWRMRYNHSQAIIPGCRIHIVLHDPDPAPGEPDPRHLLVTKVVDPLSPPPSPAPKP